jgi:phage-related tail fiber protein
MAKNYQINEKLEDGSLNILHPETNSGNVIESDSKQFISKGEKDKLSGIESGAEVNIIEGVTVNGVDATIQNKKAILTVSVDAGVKLTYDATTGKVALLNKDNTELSSVDLPLELMIESGSYNSSTQNIELVLANGDKILVPAGDLVDEYNADGTTITLGSNNTFSIAQSILTRLSNVETKATTNATAITNITNGTTKVKKAESADSATSAGKLSSSKTITLSGDASATITTDFSSNATATITLGNSGVTAGTYSAVTVDAKGRVTNGAQVIEVGSDTQTTPSSSLAVGGLFFKKI